VTDRAFISLDSCTLPVLHCTEISQPMSLMGQTLPSRSTLVPINVRCYSHSDIIVRRGEVTLRADSVEKVASPPRARRARDRANH
jgi:hypothetical protein